MCVSVRKSRKSLLKAIYNSIQKLSIVGGVSKSHVSHISLIDKYIYLNIYIFKATCCVCVPVQCGAPVFCPRFRPKSPEGKVGVKDDLILVEHKQVLDGGCSSVADQIAVLVQE